MPIDTTIIPQEVDLSTSVDDVSIQATGNPAILSLKIPSAKGGLVTHDGTDFVEKAVGAEGTILTSDPDNSTGLLYAHGFTEIATNTLSGDVASVTFSSLPAWAKHFKIVIFGQRTITSGGGRMQVLVNGATGTDYENASVGQVGGSANNTNSSGDQSFLLNATTTSTTSNFFIDFDIKLMVANISIADYRGGYFGSNRSAFTGGGVYSGAHTSITSLVLNGDGPNFTYKSGSIFKLYASG